MDLDPTLDSIRTLIYKIPTDLPESDGTIKWDQTTMVIVEITSKNLKGIGYVYGHEAIGQVIEKTFLPFLKQTQVLNIPFLYEKMLDESRNIGTRGIVASAIGAVDIALWDLKAKLLKLPLCHLFGAQRESVPIYGSGGFTSYTNDELKNQFLQWKDQGITKFKMKVGRDTEKDPARVKLAREVIGPSSKLFVDANGAYTRKQALELADSFKEYNVTWFEEPVSSDDLDGLHLLRDRAPAGMNIAAGEYGYDIFYFKKMLEAQSVDIIQADATRCRGFTGFLQVCDLSRAFNIPLSSHCAPSIHLHPALSQRHVCHMEYFHDHVRIEKMFFDGFPELKDGSLHPHLNRFGHGLELKENDVKNFLI